MTNSKIIVEKVGALFMKFGIKSITMDDVAQELGISKKTLYQIVSDKKELIELVVYNDLTEFKSKVQQIKDDNDAAILEMINIQNLIFDFISNMSLATNYDLKKYHSDIYNYIKDAYFDLVHELLTRNLIKGKQEKVYRKEINEKVLCNICILQIEQIPYSEMVSLETFTSKPFATEIIGFVLNGIVNEKGKGSLNKILKVK